MTNRNSIAQFILAGSFAMLLGACASGTNRANVDPAVVAGPADTGEETGSVSDFSRRLEDTKGYQNTGDSERFAESRDSLVDDVNNYIRLHPHAENEAKFVQLLNSLSALDTLQSDILIETDGSTLEDSLAMRDMVWQSDVADDGPMFSDEDIFPTISSPRIDFWLTYFTGPGRERFERAVYRMQLHRPTVQAILDEMDVPQELICIALIESGFAMKATSRARAVGPWQFIHGTAKRYKLRVNWWYDERRDVIASTYAACNYLKDLHSIWDDWYLAFAAYNCGEYRVARQIARQKTEDFWKLDLPLQTERYVPKFLAALYILREPEKYGFTIPQVEPISFDLVTVDEATDLDVLARCAGTTSDIIRELNPQLRRGATPPNMEIHIRVPEGAGETCVAALSDIPAKERLSWSEHRVKKGETLSGIAARYGTSVEAIRDANGLKRRSMLQINQMLMIPVSGVVSNPALANSKPLYMNPSGGVDRAALERYAKRASAGYTVPAGSKRIVYKVKRGDTLSEIAEQYHVGLSRLRAWNNLSRRRHIYAGQKLVIYTHASYQVADASGASSGPVTTADESRFEKTKHVVVRGETLYGIGKQYGVSIRDLMSWNGLRRSTIRTGDVLVIWTPRTGAETGGR